MQIRNKKDFISGLMMIGFGLMVLLISSTYSIGTAFHMGPGYFPFALSLVLIVLGLLLSGLSFRSAYVTAIPRIAWRPVFIVSAAIVIFGLFIDSAGILVMTFIMSVVSRFARPGYPWVETIVLSVLITVACTAVFYFGLNVQIPLLPTV